MLCISCVAVTDCVWIVIFLKVFFMVLNHKWFVVFLVETIWHFKLHILLLVVLFTQLYLLNDYKQFDATAPKKNCRP